MKYFVISFICICLLHVIFVLPWDKASNSVLEGIAFPKGSVTPSLGRYIAAGIYEAEMRKGGEEMLLLDFLMVLLGSPSDVP